MSGLNYSFAGLKDEYCSITFGEMAEWSIATVSNTVKPVGFEGSNPSLSAKRSGQRQIITVQKPTSQ